MLRSVTSNSFVLVPIELAIRGNSPYVEEAIVFGAGRPQVGCLVLPSELGKDLSKDRNTFLEKIWPVVEEANAQAPTHSRLLPEMVHILEYVILSQFCTHLVMESVIIRYGTQVTDGGLDIYN